MNRQYLFLVLGVLAIGAVLIFYRSNLPFPLSSTASPSPTVLLGGDKDEHGCIMSAGYSWCEVKNKCLRIWEEPCIADDQMNETEKIKADVKAAIVAKHGQTANNLEISVSKIIGEYAQGGASEEGLGGGMWFAKNVGGSWELVWDGNGVITCDDLVDYSDLPTDMVPECYNPQSGNMIERV